MKKVLSFLIIASICLSILVMGTSCSSTDQIEEFKEKIEEAGSYQLSMTMTDVPFLGTFTMTAQIDGNIQYTPASMFGEEKYTETVGDATYEYKISDTGEWIKTKIENTDDDSSDVMSDESFAQLFNPDNYEKVEKNTYKQKDDVTFEEYRNVKLTIEEDSCTFEMTVDEDGMTCGVTIVISKIGEIELALPQVS